jgi:hypothetical protein
MYPFVSSDTIQASDQLLEFLRNFYAVFPEYRTMDVGSIHLIVHTGNSAQRDPLDLHSRRELCRTIHS